jgi:hypothetical protein
MRHCIGQSNGLVPSLLCPSWVDCIIATRGYDFRKGHPSCKSCILGPSSTMPEAAKALAVIINEFGVGDEKALAMLKALHTASMV